MSRLHDVLRNDLLERIKERHDLWFRDSVELYRMARLKPAEAVNDVLTVTAYQIIWLIDYYDLNLDDFIDGLKNSFSLLKKEREE